MSLANFHCCYSVAAQCSLPRFEQTGVRIVFLRFFAAAFKQIKKCDAPKAISMELKSVVNHIDWGEWKGVWRRWWWRERRQWRQKNRAMEVERLVFNELSYRSPTTQNDFPNTINAVVSTTPVGHVYMTLKYTQCKCRIRFHSIHIMPNSVDKFHREIRWVKFRRISHLLAVLSRNKNREREWDRYRENHTQTRVFLIKRKLLSNLNIQMYENENKSQRGYGWFLTDASIRLSLLCHTRSTLTRWLRCSVFTRFKVQSNAPYALYFFACNFLIWSACGSIITIWLRSASLTPFQLLPHSSFPLRFTLFHAQLQSYCSSFTLWEFKSKFRHYFIQIKKRKTLTALTSIENTRVRRKRVYT